MKSKTFPIGKILNRIFIYALLVLMAAFFLMPLVTMLFTSIKSPQEVVDVFSLPHMLYYQNYITAISQIGRGLLNSIIITLPAVFISTMIGAIGAYPLSQFRFKGDSIVYMVLLSGLFIPYQIILIPLLQIVRGMHLYDSYVGMWIVHAAYGIPICTFYMRNYFSTIPKALLEAAILDGCSLSSYFFRILIKLSKPSFAVVIILQSRSIWNDLLFGLTLTRSPSIRPVTVELARYVSQTNVQYGPLMAATLISIIPTVLIFLIFKQSFIAGILGGSIKS